MVEWIQSIGDGIAICMCVVTVMLLIRQQLKYRSTLSNRSPERDFKQQLTRLVNDSPARAEMPSLYEASGRPSPRVDPPSGDEKEKRVPLRSQDISDPSDTERTQDHDSAVYDDNPYNQVRKLAGMGIEKEEIVKRVALPKGEIELILKLNRLNPDFKEM